MAAENVHVLIVEDDWTTRNLLQGTLKKKGYAVDQVENGEDCWKYLMEATHPVVLLLDWMLPDIDGIELCKRILEGNFQNPIHIIMITSKHESEEIVQALESGAHDFVTKPYDYEILCARINAGMRIIGMQQKIAVYASNMEELARQRAIQLAHSDRIASLGLLSAGVAHEINNPASFISVNIQTLEDGFSILKKQILGKISDTEKSQVEIIINEMPQIMHEMREGISRITDIVSGLKQFVHTERGKKSLTDIHVPIEHAMKLCANRTKKAAEVITEFDRSIPEILADSRQIEQVMVNLIMNAADAIDECKTKGGKIVIKTQKEDYLFRIEVSDNGSGLSEEFMSNLFKPFYTTKGVGKGTGLGLTISRNIIDEHGGTLSAENDMNGGAVFIVKLPLTAKKRIKD